MYFCGLRGFGCKQNAAFFLKCDNSDILTVETWGKLLNLMYTKVTDFFPEKHVRNQKNRHQMVPETDLKILVNPGFGGG